nr:MAG TPA: ECF sigma factor [Caudoviricetes sp.]
MRSQMETAIREANLGNDDTDIAKRYLIDQIPQIEIAAEFGWERSTISRRISRILLKVENAAEKLKYF